MKEVRDEAKKVDDARVRAMTEVQDIEDKLSLARANNGEHNACFCFYISKVSHTSVFIHHSWRIHINWEC